MGEALAGVCGTEAAPTEYRTAPLWGLRYRRQFLHDGRAETLLEAVAAHDGEAARARAAFARLPEARRAALLRFLESL
jgi:CxxC motif-containing protein (DUF1111 family)